jgi:DNA-binding NarL/FixJ family response regulator
MLVEPVLHHGTPMADASSPGYDAHAGAQAHYQRLVGAPVGALNPGLTGARQLPRFENVGENQFLSTHLVQRLEESLTQFQETLSRELTAHFARLETLLASTAWPAPPADQPPTALPYPTPPQPARPVAATPLRTPAPCTRILVVGKGLDCAAQIHDLLAPASEFAVLSEVADPASAVLLARRHQPEMTLVDMDVDALDPMLDLVSQLARTNPGMHLILISDQSDREFLLRALRLGVRAVLQRDLESRTAVHILRTVLRGEQVFAPPQALGGMLVEFRQVLQEQEQARFQLTDQEIEILRLAAVGLNNKEIGTRQFWSEITIKRKMGEIYRKLGVKSRAQAVAEAVRLGLI